MNWSNIVMEIYKIPCIIHSADAAIGIAPSRIACTSLISSWGYDRIIILALIYITVMRIYRTPFWVLSIDPMPIWGTWQSEYSTGNCFHQQLRGLSFSHQYCGGTKCNICIDTWPHGVTYSLTPGVNFIHTNNSFRFVRNCRSIFLNIHHWMTCT